MSSYDTADDITDEEIAYIQSLYAHMDDQDEYARWGFI